MSEMIIGMQPADSVENKRFVCAESPRGQGQNTEDDGATLDNLREAVTTLEDTERTARRVLGGAHPVVGSIEAFLRHARAALAARETPSASA